MNPQLQHTKSDADWHSSDTSNLDIEIERFASESGVPPYVVRYFASLNSSSALTQAQQINLIGVGKTLQLKEH